MDRHNTGIDQYHYFQYNIKVEKKSRISDGILFSKTRQLKHRKFLLLIRKKKINKWEEFHAKSDPSELINLEYKVDRAINAITKTNNLHSLTSQEELIIHNQLSFDNWHFNPSFPFVPPPPKLRNQFRLVFFSIICSTSVLTLIKETQKIPRHAYSWNFLCLS